MSPHKTTFTTLRTIRELFTILGIIAIAATSCTKVDMEFGNDFVPPSQIMGSSIDSTIVVKTYISSYDSLLSSGINISPYVGSLINPYTGRTQYSFFASYAPKGFDHTYYFGIDPVIDSMKISFTFVPQAEGDSTQSMEISVYEVKGHHFRKDSSYYSNFDMTPYIGDTPLVTFTQKGDGGVSVHPLPIEFARRMLDNRQDKTNIYYSDTAFHSVFNGVYITAKPVNSGPGTMLKAQLDQSVMNLFYHSTNPETKKLDTLSQQLQFWGDMTFDNVNFNITQNDYSFADPSKKGVVTSQIGDTINESQYCYIQGYRGLMGLVKIDTVSLNQLKAKAIEQGYNHIALHRAELQVAVVDPSEKRFAGSFLRTALYFNINKLEFLTEYNPILEAANIGYTPTIDGYLNRSIAMYKYDITSYVQRLITGKYSQATTQLLQEYDLSTSLSHSVVYGSASPYPPKLILTYTMIK